jgi:hypothetical protein
MCPDAFASFNDALARRPPQLLDLTASEMPVPRCSRQVKDALRSGTHVLASTMPTDVVINVRPGVTTDDELIRITGVAVQSESTTGTTITADFSL